MQTATPLLEQGVACLIEKPLASSVDQARALLAVAEKADVLLQVGHTERFNPAVRAVAAMDITPRFMQVDRVSPMTFRSLDIGVVMDLMIHDLDIVLMLARAPLTRVEAVGVGVLGQHEDVANARLQFADGCVATIAASRLALKTERKMRVFSEDAYVRLNYADGTGMIIRRTANAAALADLRQQIAAGVDLSDIDYSQLVKVDTLTMDDPQQDALEAQLDSFVRAVREGRPPEVDAKAGCAAVEAAERVIASIRAHQWQGLPAMPV